MLGMKGEEAKAKLRSFAQPTTYLGLGMLAFIYVMLAQVIVSDRQVAETSAISRNENLVRTIEQAFSHAFASVDASLLFIRELYRENPQSFDLSAKVQSSLARNKLTLDYSINDANGNVVDMSLLKHVVGFSIVNQESFQYQAKATEDQPFISKPIRVITDGAVGIIMNRRIVAADGTFAGTIGARIDPVELARIVSSIDLGAGSSVNLIGLDGFQRVRVVNGKIDWQALMQPLPPRAAILKQAAQSNSGSFWGTPKLYDDVTRLVSFRKLESLPLLAVVTISREEVFRQADNDTMVHVGIALALTAAILVAIGFGARRERRLTEATRSAEQVRDELRQSQERYRKVEEAVNDGIWDLNLKTGEVYRSPRWKAILGFADHEFPNTKEAFNERIHPEDREKVLAAHDVHIKSQTPFETEMRLLCKNGDYRWVLSRGKPQFDDEGRSVRMLGTMTDVHERKQAEALIEENRSNLSRAEMMARLGHFKFDIASGRIFWSDGAYQIFEKSPDDFALTIENIVALFHPDDRPVLEKARRGVLAGIEQPPTKFRILKADGAIGYVESWSAPQRASDGTVIGLFGTYQDITARMIAEQALKREIREREEAQIALAQVNRDLEQRVAERTAELAQEAKRREEAQARFAQVQKMEAVGQLTAGIAHDFNNLLAVIKGGLGFIEEAARRGLPAEPELIDASIRATRRGSDLVQRLLAFSRQAPLKAEPSVVDQVVLDTLRLLQRTLGEGIEVTMSLDSVAAQASVDRSGLSNALVNLAINARDAMPEGGRLKIETSCVVARWAAQEGAERWPTGDAICIGVADSGEGMSEEVRNRAFEPFFTTKPDGLGTGLGLSMVMGFVEQSGGHIEIESVEGRGTEIKMFLPRIEPVAEAEQTVMGGMRPTKGRKSVLLVEDDPDVRIVTAAQLRKLGFNVYTAANGSEAIDLIASPADIDVTLTDMVLPGGVDGAMLIEEVMRARPSMGVLCMSGYDPSPTHREWLSIQNIELLEKPFSQTSLARALEHALGG